MTQPTNIKIYHRRYLKVMEDLREITHMLPREKYMVRLMNTVIFQDFETALDTMIEDFEASNDNYLP